MQQQLALALGRMVVPCAVQVFGDVRALQPHLATAVDGDERLGQRCAAFAQRLDLGAGQGQPCLVLVFDGIVMPGLLVLDDEFLTGFLGHVSSFRGQ